MGTQSVLSIDRDKQMLFKKTKHCVNVFFEMSVFFMLKRPLVCWTCWFCKFIQGLVGTSSVCGRYSRAVGLKGCLQGRQDASSIK